MRGEGGVAGAGRVVGVPKFHSWGAMPLTNINSDLMCNASSGLCINLHYLFMRVLYFASWGVMSITAPQDAHKLVLQVAEWLTASLSGLARYELTT